MGLGERAGQAIERRGGNKLLLRPRHIRHDAKAFGIERDVAQIAAEIYERHLVIRGRIAERLRVNAHEDRMGLFARGELAEQHLALGRARQLGEAALLHHQ